MNVRWVKQEDGNWRAQPIPAPTTFEEEVAELRRRREQDAIEAERRKVAWDQMLQRYFDTAKTEAGLAMIERMLSYQDRDAVEICNYVRGLIAEIRRLRGTT